MMITDETLILYFYNDGLTPEERAQVNQALEQNSQLAQKYEVLCQDMGSLRGRLAQTDTVVNKRQWQRALDDEIDSKSLSQQSHPWLLHKRALAMAATLIIFVAGLVIGRGITDESNDVSGQSVTAKNTESYEPPIPKPASTLFVRGIATHFESTQIQLASMDMDNASERDELIQKIISQNRFFLKAAKQNDADDVARLLRAFEPLLLSMSTGSESNPTRSAVLIREQLEFELGVTLTKFSHQTSNRRNEF